MTTVKTSMNIPNLRRRPLTAVNISMINLLLAFLLFLSHFYFKHIIDWWNTAAQAAPRSLNLSILRLQNRLAKHTGTDGAEKP